MKYDFAKSYNEGVSVLERIVNSRETSLYCIWLDIGKIYLLYDDVGLGDFLGILARELETNSCWSFPTSDIVFMLREKENDAKYGEFCDMYHLSDNLNEMGRYWRDLIRGCQTEQLTHLIWWLEMYRKNLLPGVKRRAEEFYIESGLMKDSKTLILADQKYNEYIRQLGRIRKKIKTTIEILNIMQGR